MKTYLVTRPNQAFDVGSVSSSDPNKYWNEKLVFPIEKLAKDKDDLIIKHRFPTLGVVCVLASIEAIEMLLETGYTVCQNIQVDPYSGEF